MGYNIQFISDLNQFEDTLFSAIKKGTCHDIFISGAWNKTVYEKILSQIIKNNCCHKCRIIIPNMSNNGSMPIVFINKIAKLKGRIRVNSKQGGSMLIIDENAFIASFSYREKREGGINTYFECCMLTNNEIAVNDIKNRFINAWEDSLPLISEVV